MDSRSYWTPRDHWLFSQYKSFASFLIRQFRSTSGHKNYQEGSVFVLFLKYYCDECQVQSLSGYHVSLCFRFSLQSSNYVPIKDCYIVNQTTVFLAESTEFLAQQMNASYVIVVANCLKRYQALLNHRKSNRNDNVWKVCYRTVASPKPERLTQPSEKMKTSISTTKSAKKLFGKTTIFSNHNSTRAGDWCFS